MPKRFTLSSSGSISATVICKKVPSAATPTFQCAQSVKRIWHTLRNQELELLPLLEEAINIEVRRQIELIEDGGTVVQETRLYDPDRKETRSMRSKEDSQDYRYFPDPDLPPLRVSSEWIEQVRSTMPELPTAMRARFSEQYDLSDYDCMVLTQSKSMAAYFEAALAASSRRSSSQGSTKPNKSPTG